MTVDEIRRMERQMEEMGIDIDTIITIVAIAQNQKQKGERENAKS